MYKNRISRSNSNGQQHFFIRRSEIAFERRTAFVESVLALLIESRFGPGRVSPFVIDLSDHPELEPVVFYDLFDEEPNGLIPCYALSPQGRAGYQVVEAAYRRAKQMGLLATRPNERNSTAALAPNQGRGSP